MPTSSSTRRCFFDRWYRPEKTTVILVGDLDAEATFELVKKYWGGWERGDYDVEVPVEPPLGGPKYEHMQWDGPTQPWFVMAFRGPAYVPTEKDMPALDLISQIYFSESSDLYRQLVLEDQSVDQLFAWFPDRKDPGILMIAARLTDASRGDRCSRRRSTARWRRRGPSLRPQRKSRKPSRACATASRPAWTARATSARSSRRSRISIATSRSSTTSTRPTTR